MKSMVRHCIAYGCVHSSNKPLNIYTATLNKMMLKKREKAGPKRTLSVEEEFLLVLGCYKVGLLEKDLAGRFRISQSLVSQIIIICYLDKFYVLQIQRTRHLP